MNGNGIRRRRGGATAAAVTVALLLGALQGCGTGGTSAGANGGATDGSPGSETLSGAGQPSPAPTGGVTHCTGKQPVGSGSPSTGEKTANGVALERVLSYVNQAGASRYRTVFTGVAVDEDTRTVDVYRITSQEFDADICAMAGKGVTVRLHDTRVDRADLDALSDRISADMHRWDGVFQLREVGVDSKGYVHVGVDNPAKAEPLLRKAFGGEYIKVSHVDQAQLDAWTGTGTGTG